jgi:hypothetical protein
MNELAVPTSVIFFSWLDSMYNLRGSQCVNRFRQNIARQIEVRWEYGRHL